MIKTAILAALAEGPMHGYQVMQRIHELSGGVWRPSPGSVYPTLQEFEDRGLVRGDAQEGKRVYALTDEGEAEVGRLREAHGAPPWWSGEHANAARMKLRQGLDGLASAVRQVGTTGSDDLVEQTISILADARRRIYALLAEAD